MSDYDQEHLEILAAEVGALLLRNGQRLVTAESCTGGWVAHCLTAVAGSSEWFDRGFISYSNDAKQDMLGVSPDTLDTHGAVSEAAAASMAFGALRQSKSDWAVAITGIAGPGGGSGVKPVGTVCFGWAGPDGRLDTATRNFAGGRAEVRAQSVAYALRGVLERATYLST